MLPTLMEVEHDHDHDFFPNENTMNHAGVKCFHFL